MALVNIEYFSTTFTALSRKLFLQKGLSQKFAGALNKTSAEQNKQASNIAFFYYRYFIYIKIRHFDFALKLFVAASDLPVFPENKFLDTFS